jgi:quercetin dioxygenase-like cupin family protein
VNSFKQSGFLLALLGCAMANAADPPVVTPLMLKELIDIPGKEALVITVAFPPGGEDPVHRHPGHAFVYVLEGSIVMQMEGEAPVTLHPGQVFYERPNHVHAVGRNASRTQPAKFLVVLIKDKGADAVLPAN